MPVTLPLEVYEAFEKSLGKEEAKKIVKSLEITISELTEHKWKISKDELLEAMRKDFVTKEVFEERINALKSELINIIQQNKAELLSIIKEDKTELLGRIDALYEKIEKDKTELLGIMKQDKAELLGIMNQDKTELLGIMKQDKAELLGIMKQDKAELLGRIDALYEKIEKDKTELLGIMKQDKAELEGKIELVKAEVKRIDMKLNFLIILMIIALTLMNPVMAEIIKKLLNL